MASSNTGTILMESKKVMKKMHNIDINDRVDFKNMLAQDEMFDTYKASLLESIGDPEVKNVVNGMMNKTRLALMESVSNSFNQLANYETLALPLLSNFYPRLISKELVTVKPITSPDTILPFLNYTFTRADGTKAVAPSYDTVSFGRAVTRTDAKYINPGMSNILTLNNLTDDLTSIERTFQFFKFECTVGGASVSIEKDMQLTVDGNFYEELEQGANTYVITGKLEWLTGRVTFMINAIKTSDGSAVTVTDAKLYYCCTFSLEQNTMNTKITPTLDKPRLTIEDQQVSADWTIQLEQDANALYDLDIQSAIIDILGQQMALDTDTLILKDILRVANGLDASHIDTFSQTPPAGYTLGPVYWYQNILQKLMKLSARVYTDTNIGEANVIAANPMDAAIFESLNKFSFDGKGSDGGAVGYTSGNLAQRWKVFSSPIVPEGKCILMHKPTDFLRVIYVWAPYQPAVMSPYPLGNTPSLTIMSRYAKMFYRPKGCALLNITA